MRLLSHLGGDGGIDMWWEKRGGYNQELPAQLDNYLAGLITVVCYLEG